MPAIWNIRDLNPPPNLSYEVRLIKFNAVELATVCSDAISILADQKALHLEAATLSRLLYRMKCKFRCDKGFKYLAKVNQGLLRYLTMNMEVVFQTIKPLHPDSGYHTVSVPSRQLLEWVLLRIQGFAKLFCQVMKSCEQAGYYMTCRLYLGHVWDVALISLAIVGRIRSISKYLVLCACAWYSKLKPYLEILKPVGLPWLPINYEFPADLKNWLGVNLVTNPAQRKCSLFEHKSKHTIFDLIDLNFDEEDEGKNENESGFTNKELLDFSETALSNETMIIESHIKEAEKSEIFVQHSQLYEDNEKHVRRNIVTDFSLPKNNLTTGFEDIGEPVSSSDFYSLLPSNTLDYKLVKPKEVEKVKKSGLTSPTTKFKNPERGKKHQTNSHLSAKQQIKAIKTSQDLKSFLYNEQKLRKKKSSSSLTVGLDKMQWHMLKKTLHNLLCKLSSNVVVKGSDKYEKILNRARKDIWIRIKG
ncbi:uncharacterized protein [Periplaneta americana]|uniref:uncharacterized protein isoform X2 n=1 Tax=Periplaneta americana TaxID=6978 RepID=UPI0037E7827D